MPLFTTRLSETLAKVAQIVPGQYAAGTYLSGAINVFNIQRSLWTLTLGTVPAGSTVAFQLVASATAGGTYVPIATKQAATVAAGTAPSVVEIDLRDDEISALGMPFVKAQVVVAGASGAPLAVLAQGACGRYKPEANASNIPGQVAAPIF